MEHSTVKCPPLTAQLRVARDDEIRLIRDGIDNLRGLITQTRLQQYSIYEAMQHILKRCYSTFIPVRHYALSSPNHATMKVGIANLLRSRTPKGFRVGCGDLAYYDGEDVRGMLALLFVYSSVVRCGCCCIRCRGPDQALLAYATSPYS